MFGKYNIKDLFLAVIEITYPYADLDPESGLLMSKIVNYDYCTILRKKDQGYIDLQENDVIYNYMASYHIKFLEPLGAYYTFDGRKKRTINKKDAIQAAKIYYKSIYNKKS